MKAIPGKVELLKLTAVWLFGAAFIAPAFSEVNYSSSWRWVEYAAFTRFESGIDISVSFIPASNCNRALLLISGNEEISRVSLDVDLTTSDPVSVTRVKGGVYMGITIDQIELLKTGSNAALITDQGILTMSLDGSAKAINGAWQNCKAIAKAGEQKAPPLQANDLRLSDEGRVPDGQIFNVNEDNVLAAGNVIFVFQKIDSDDAAIVERIVKDMHRQGIRLKSIVFYNNYGGSLKAAMDLGGLIRRLRANTAAVDVCASACIYGFAGGAQRTSYINTRFGLHQTRYSDRSAGTLSEGQEIAAARYSYLERMGVNPKIAIWESEVQPESMRWISQYEAKGLNLANMIIEKYELPSGIGQ